jgi:ribosome maturation factor RimP
MAPDPTLEIVRRHVAALGFELVEFRQAGPPPRPALQVRIDRPDSRPGRGVTADDCARVSRALERALEEAGVVGPWYRLQVSSPGFERPVRFPEHWRRYAGRTVRVRVRGMGGRPRGRIVDVPDDGHVRLALLDGTELLLALADIKEAILESPDDPGGPGSGD